MILFLGFLPRDFFPVQSYYRILEEGKSKVFQGILSAYYVRNKKVVSYRNSLAFLSIILECRGDREWGYE